MGFYIVPIKLVHLGVGYLQTSLIPIYILINSEDTVNLREEYLDVIFCL